MITLALCICILLLLITIALSAEKICKAIREIPQARDRILKEVQHYCQTHDKVSLHDVMKVISGDGK